VVKYYRINTKEVRMFDFILEDDGLVQRLKELKAYYKKADEKKLETQKKLSDSVLREVFKVYPGM